MTTHASNDGQGLELDQYKILRHLFHLAADNAPKDWEFFGSNTEEGQMATEYQHRTTGDRIKAWSFDRVDGEFTKHLFTFKQGSDE